MPLHYHPLLRDMEQARESVALIQVLNSVGYTVIAAEETTLKKAQPAIFVGHPWHFGGGSQTHKG